MASQRSYDDGSGVLSDPVVDIKLETLEDAYRWVRKEDPAFDVASYRQRQERCLDDLSVSANMDNPVYQLFRKRINGRYDPSRELELFEDFVRRNILAARIIESEEGSVEQRGLAREVLEIENDSFHAAGEISLYLWTSYFVS